MTGSPPCREPHLTVCVLARDEAANLVELLPQLRWADELLVVIDAASTDASTAVAQNLADRVEVQPFTSFSAFRNRAIALAHGRWIFFVDADERVSPRLAEEVRSVTGALETSDHEGGPPPVAYWVGRHNIMFGRLIRGGGWSPDYQLRLLRRDCARYDERRLVHETPAIDGDAGYLAERLLHFNYANVPSFIEKQRRYTAMEAGELRSSGLRPRRRSYVGGPLRSFITRYFVLGGWTDGPIGLFLCLAMAYFAFQRVRIARRDPAGNG